MDWNCCSRNHTATAFLIRFLAFLVLYESVHKLRIRLTFQVELRGSKVVSQLGQVEYVRKVLPRVLERTDLCCID